MTIADTIKSAGARLTMSADDVRALLERDHDEVKELLRALSEGQRGRSRQQLLATLTAKVTAHARAEEAVVYDALIRARAERETHVLAEEGYVEHGAVDDLLARLARLPVGTELWQAHIKAVREMLEHHIREEQNETFAQLGELFSREELIALGDEFLRRKARVLTRPGAKTQRNVARVVGGQRGRKTSAGAATKRTRAKQPAKRASARPARRTRAAAKRSSSARAR